MTITSRFLSLGAGVQSTTLALMAASGEIMPMPDAAIFADTQAEPAKVYEHLDWLMGPGILPFPVIVVTAGSLLADLYDPRAVEREARGRRFLSAPRRPGGAATAAMHAKV